jgi:hypothetical protein
LIVTNHETEMHSLFVNVDGSVFADVTLPTGIGPATRPYVGFGVAFLDYDNDGRLDIAIANGHVMANAALVRATFAQRNLLLRQVDGRFRDMKDQAGPGFSIELVSRGLAAGDIDNDGDLDLLVTNNGGPANLLLNEGGSSARLTGAGDRDEKQPQRHRCTAHADHGHAKAGPRGAVRVELSRPERLRAHFGLGEAIRSERLEIRWPSGMTEVVKDLPANQIVTVREGEGVVERVPFRLR